MIQYSVSSINNNEKKDKLERIKQHLTLRPYFHLKKPLGAFHIMFDLLYQGGLRIKGMFIT